MADNFAILEFGDNAADPLPRFGHVLRATNANRANAVGAMASRRRFSTQLPSTVGAAINWGFDRMDLAKANNASAG